VNEDESAFFLNRPLVIYPLFGNVYQANQELTFR